MSGGNIVRVGRTLCFGEMGIIGDMPANYALLSLWLAGYD
jgi:hypothetical protein